MDIPKRIKREKAVTVRLKQTTYENLCKLAKRNDVSQADVIEYLIEKAHDASKQKKK